MLQKQRNFATSGHTENDMSLLRQGYQGSFVKQFFQEYLCTYFDTVHTFLGILIYLLRYSTHLFRYTYVPISMQCIPFQNRTPSTWPKCREVAMIIKAGIESALYWAGAMVQWLLEETHVPKVMGSNPSAVYWLDIFHIYYKKNYVCQKKTKINEKRPGKVRPHPTPWNGSQFKIECIKKFSLHVTDHSTIFRTNTNFYFCIFYNYKNLIVTFKRSFVLRAFDWILLSSPVIF